jgi:hypothetical protein
MIEVAFTYDFLPGIDQAAYAKFAKRATAVMVSSKGFVEFRAHRNLIGSPQVRRTSVWETFADWAKLVESPEFQNLTVEFRTYVTNIDIQIWGPSPLTPTSIRAEK